MTLTPYVPVVRSSARGGDLQNNTEAALKETPTDAWNERRCNTRTREPFKCFRASNGESKALPVNLGIRPSVLFQPSTSGMSRRSK